MPAAAALSKEEALRRFMLRKAQAARAPAEEAAPPHTETSAADSRPDEHEGSRSSDGHDSDSSGSSSDSDGRAAKRSKKSSKKSKKARRAATAHCSPEPASGRVVRAAVLALSLALLPVG